MPRMANIAANGIQIEYDTFGTPGASPLLLVMGLGAQMIAWDEAFCEQLADAGHHVIRFDNRDVGLSTHLDGAAGGDIMAAMAAQAAGKPVVSAYLLADLADDAAALLGALGIPAAHIVGASMGGMIVQEMAIRHPDRVLTMTSIMSTTGAPDLPPAKPEVMARLMGPVPEGREAIIASAIESSRVFSSTGFPFDEAKVRERAERAYDRRHDPAGMARQLVAILASGSRRERLKRVTAPTLVIHGVADPLVPIEGGRDTAASIAGARMLEIEGMGHDLPVGAWDEIVTAIAELTAVAAAV